MNNVTPKNVRLTRDKVLNAEWQRLLFSCKQMVPSDVLLLYAIHILIRRLTSRVMLTKAITKCNLPCRRVSVRHSLPQGTLRPSKTSPMNNISSTITIVSTYQHTSVGGLLGDV